MLWLWAVALLMVIALVWSVVAWRGASGGSRAGPRTWTLALPLVLILLLGIRSLVEAPGAEASDNELSLSLNALVAPTTRALDDGVGAATGRDGRYLVSFDDPLHIGSQAYGLVTELERAGFEVGMDVPFAVPITEHRKLRPEEATARVELVTGIQRDAWVDKPGVVEVAMVDLRSPDELAELEQLRADVTDQLEAEGLDDLIPLLDTNLFLAAIDGRASEPLRVKMNRMLKIGTPTSVFIAPIDARP